MIHHAATILPWLWHPEGQCTAASSNHIIAAHEIARCKSYNVWSGILSDISEAFPIITLGALWWHHHICSEPRCFRKGHPDPEHGHPVCRKHQDKFPTREGTT